MAKVWTCARCEADNYLCDCEKEKLQQEIKELKKDLKLLRHATKMLLPYIKEIADKIPNYVKLAIMLAIDESLDED